MHKANRFGDHVERCNTHTFILFLVFLNTSKSQLNMAEVLAVTASIVAVLTITNAVLSVCYNYGAAVKTASLAVADIERELEDLRAVLQSLEPIANKAEFSDTGLIDLDKLCPLLQAELDGLLEKLKTPAWAANFGPKRTKVMQSIIWPLKAVETQKTIETISRHKATLHLALSVGQTYASALA